MLPIRVSSPPPTCINLFPSIEVNFPHTRSLRSFTTKKKTKRGEPHHFFLFPSKALKHRTRSNEHLIEPALRLFPASSPPPPIKLSATVHRPCAFSTQTGLDHYTLETTHEVTRNRSKGCRVFAWTFRAFGRRVGLQGPSIACDVVGGRLMEDLKAMARFHSGRC